ncbi:MAG: PKD domain-containing protein [Candidatus Bathyarchaeia archaeon]
MNKKATGMKLTLLFSCLFCGMTSVTPVTATANTMDNLRVNVLLDYGNETYSWHFGVLLPETATALDATLAIATVNYTLWDGDVFVDAINGLWNSHPHYWMWWYWNKTEWNWTLGPVACNNFALKNGDVIAWYYENCTHWPPPPPAFSVSINPATAKIKVGESAVFTSSALGGKPPYTYQWHLNESVVLGATSSTWNFTPTATSTYIVYLIVTDNITNTAKSNEATITVASKLITSISPINVSSLVGQSITFTSTASGGLYPPYNYQWHLNDVPISGATLDAWTFTPTTGGIYFIHLKVTDAEGNIAQSEPARVSVATAPVGGYSTSIKEQTKSVKSYMALITILTIALIIIKPRKWTIMPNAFFCD